MNISIANTRCKISRFWLFLFLGIILSLNSVSQDNELILAVVEKDGYMGIIDTTGKWYISNTYNYIGEISEGYAQVVRSYSDIEGFIHLKTKTFVPYECWNKGDKVDGYENLSVFDYIFLYAMPENGDTVYKPSKYLDDSLMAQSLFYDTLYKPNYTFVNGIAPIWIGPESNCRYEYENGKWGYITKKGSWIVEPICDIGRFPSEGYLIVEQDLMLKYYDIINKRFITTPYNFGNTFNEGLSCVSIIDDTLVQYIANIGLENEGKWGYLNKKLKEVIPLKFDLAYSFSNDYAVVFKNHKYGFIDKRGNLRIKYQFNAVTDFVDNRAGARKDSLYGIIDKNGNWIKKPIYDRLFNYSYKMAVASFYNKIGFVDLDGDWVISPEFDYARPFCDANAKNCIDCLSPVRFYEPLIEIEIPLPPDPDF